MKKTLIGIATATALVTGAVAGISGAAQAAGPLGNGAVDNGIVNVGHKHYRGGLYLWKYDYQPRYVCKRHYRWKLTRYGWRNVYVGYWCDHTNNY